MEECVLAYPGNSAGGSPWIEGHAIGCERIREHVSLEPADGEVSHWPRICETEPEWRRISSPAADDEAPYDLIS